MPQTENLTRLLTMLRHELKLSANVAHNRQVHDQQVYALQRAQRDLWAEFDWPYLMVYRDSAVTAGMRYLDPPTDIARDNIVKMFVRYGGDWLPLKYGITPEHYSAFDSDLGDRSTPTERWQLYEDSQIEIWPIPDTASDATTLEGKLRFWGKRELARLVDEADRCELDADDIVLFAATKLATGETRKDIQEKWRLRHADIRAGLSPGGSFQMFGLTERQHGKQLRGPPRVHYRVTS